MYNWVTLLCKRNSVLFSHSVVSDSLQPHGLHHTRLPCPPPTPRAYSNSCPSSQWCHPIISSSVVPFSSCLQSFPASGSFPMSQFFSSGGQSIGASASASVLPTNIQDWFPLGLTVWISLQSAEINTPLYINYTSIKTSLKKTKQKKDFPGGSAGKESPCNLADLGLIPGLGRCPREGATTHSSILAWRIPQTMSGKESNTTEQLSLHFHTSIKY